MDWLFLLFFVGLHCKLCRVKTMRNRVLLLCIAIVCSVLSGYAQSYYFKHLGIADGLSQVRITAVCQDKTGAVWLGSSEGLNRYNGNDVRLFHPS